MINPYDPYLDWIDSQKQTLLQRVKEWVAINTFTLNPDGIERFSSVLQAAFSPLSPLCVSINLPLLKSLGPDGKLHSRVLGPALSFRKRPEAPLMKSMNLHREYGRARVLPT
jgi:glutamate carboxypeptidase